MVPHTVEDIHQCYDEIVMEFEVANKIIAVVTNGAANMVKAFSLPGYVDIDESEVEEEVADLEPVILDMMEVMETLMSFATQLKLSHSHQLVDRDALKDAGQLEISFASELLEKCNKVQLANATRWNSQLKMIRSSIQVPEDIIDKITFPGKQRAHELKLKHNLCEIWKPFKEATNLSQGQNVVTSSKVIVCIRSLWEQLRKLSINHSCRLLNFLESLVDTRLSKYEYMEVFQLATVFDPQYKVDWCTDEVD